MRRIDEKTRKKAAKTRFPTPTIPNKRTKEEKVKAITKHVRDIMEILELDLQDESLAKTPMRVANMYVNEIFSGLDPHNFPDVNLISSPSKEMISVQARFYSFCEHHFVPMHGQAVVAYLPHDDVIGLSKIPRLIRFFARRPQIQERLTCQIADALKTLLGHDDVAVWIEARHYCVAARGIEDEKGCMITKNFNGQFKDSKELQDHFFQ